MQQFKIVEADNKQILVMNIYAPREYSNKKTKFFNNIIDIIEHNTRKNVVLGGEINFK